MNLVPYILRFVVVFWSLVPGFALAQTQDDAGAHFGLMCNVVQVDGQRYDLVFAGERGPGAWGVASHSTDSMFGKFSLRFQDPKPSNGSEAWRSFQPPNGRWSHSVSWTSRSSVKTRESFSASPSTRPNEATCMVKCSLCWNPCALLLKRHLL